MHEDDSARTNPIFTVYVYVYMCLAVLLIVLNAKVLAASTLAFKTIKLLVS